MSELPSVETHPYAVSFGVALGSDVELVMEDPVVTLPFGDDHRLQIRKEPQNNQDKASFTKRYTFRSEAFSSACEAEKAGLNLAVSLLWVAASRSISIKYTKWSGATPFVVKHREQSTGLAFSASVRVHSNVNVQDFVGTAIKAFVAGGEASTSLMSSLEFYASARMEGSERARFINLVVALEALSEQQAYGDELGMVLDDLAEQLKASPVLSGKENESKRDSVVGKLKDLRTESIRQAIKRTVNKHLGGDDWKETRRFLDEAYDMRSRILHEGQRGRRLNEVSSRLEEILRRVYSSILKIPLDRPVPR